MKILLLGEYSNVHNTLAQGLRELGHQVTVASNGDFWKDYPRDQDLARKPGKIGGLKLLGKVYSLLPRWRGYDVVQLINPMFLELKAERIKPIYRYLRRHNGVIVLGALGLDWYWVYECVERKPLRYSDFNIGDKLRTDDIALRDRQDWLGTPNATGGWSGTPKGELNQLIAHDCDGIVTGLYEYDVCYRPYFPEKTRFIPFPMKTKEPMIPIEPMRPIEPIKLFIGISKGRSVYKGTDIMLRAAEDVQQQYPDRLQIIKAEGVPFAQYKEMMEGCDVLMDQLYSYTPAMNALLAISKGIVVIGGGEPENYDILGETELRPIINVQPSYDSVREELEKLILHPDLISQLKAQSIAYVRQHHDYLHVARQYESFYQELRGKKEDV